MCVKRWIKYPLIFLSTLSLTGCWDSVEINKRSIILEFAIDKNEEYFYDEEKLMDEQAVYKYTYTIPDFGKLSGTQSLATDMETMVEVEGPTLAASIDDLETQTKNTISFSHVKGIMLGEALMETPALFEQTIDSLVRDMLVTRNTPIFAVNGEAALTAEVENPEQPILGLYLMDFFNNKERAVNFFEKQLLGNFIKDMEQNGISTLPIFHVEHLEEAKAAEEESTQEESSEGEQGNTGNPMSQGEDAEGEKSAKEDETTVDKGKIDISGGAVIKDYQLIDYITKEEVRSQLFIKGKIENAPVVVNYEGTPLVYHIENQKSKVTFDEINDTLECTIEIDVEGYISEYLVQGEDQKLVDGDTAEDIEEAIAKEIAEQIKPGIEKAKVINTDFIGLGLECYRHKNELWQKYENDWEKELFENLPITIGVNVDIQSTGIQE